MVRSIYQQFLTELYQIRTRWIDSHFDTNVLKKELKDHQLLVETLFQLMEEEMSEQELMISTEVHRLWRLIGTDVLFLRSARQDDTWDVRKNQILDRINQLIELSTSLLKSDAE